MVAAQETSLQKILEGLAVPRSAVSAAASVGPDNFKELWRDVIQILEQEGLEFVAGGRADTARRLSVSQLEELRKAAEDDFDASR